MNGDAIMSDPISIFVSYSHKDSKFLNELKKFLKPVLKNAEFELWDDQRIKKGTKWLEEIESSLKRSKAALLLVSKDFLDSDFIAERELPPILNRAKAGGMQILWVLVSHCQWHRTEIQDYLAVWEKTPLNLLEGGYLDEALNQITDEIVEAAKDLVAKGGLKPIVDGSDPNQLPKPPTNLPYLFEPFVGRERAVRDILADLEKGVSTVISGRGGPRYFQVNGPGGIGKSMLARHVAWHCLNEHPEWFPDGVFEILATDLTPQDLVKELKALVDHDITREPVNFQDAHRYLNEILANRKLLLLLDNQNERKYAPYLLPRHSRSMVLITTRDEELGQFLKQTRGDLEPSSHKLAFFSDEEVLQLCQRVIPNYRENDDADYLTLAQRLGRLPIALRQALNLTAYSPHWPVKKVLASWRMAKRLKFWKRDGHRSKTCEVWRPSTC